MQIPRDQNTQADALANLGLSLRDVSFTSVPIVYLTTPTISKGKDVTDIVATIGSSDQANGDYDLVTNGIEPDHANPDVAKNDVFANNEVSVSWRKPFYDYLTNDILPTDRAEARRLHLKASRYVIIQGMLFKKSVAGHNLCCLEKRHWEKVLEDLHEGPCGNHSGRRNLSNRALRMGYYWPTMKQEAIRYVTRCDNCQRHACITHKPCSPTQWHYGPT